MCFKPSKDRYKPRFLLYKRLKAESFQTLKGSLQTPPFIFVFHLIFFVSNPQRIATNTPRGPCKLKAGLVSNPQRIATNDLSFLIFSFLQLCFKPSKDRYKQVKGRKFAFQNLLFQTLKGSLQTVPVTFWDLEPGGFKPSKDRYKLIFSF